MKTQILFLSGFEINEPGLTRIGLRANRLILQCLRAIIRYSFFCEPRLLTFCKQTCNHAHFQSVRVHKSMFVGLRRATPPFLLYCAALSIVILFFVSHACPLYMYCLFVYSVMQIYSYGAQKIYTEPCPLIVSCCNLQTYVKSHLLTDRWF